LYFVEATTLKKTVPVQWVHRCCSLGFVFHYPFSAFLSSGVERWSRLEWTRVAGKPQQETAREGQRDKGGFDWLSH